jgi:hypothetical protein
MRFPETLRWASRAAEWLGAMIIALCAFMDDAKTAIWAPRRDHTRSDRLSLGFLVAASVP